VGKKKKRREVVFEPLSVPVIDSHCHLVPRVFGEETSEVVARAFEGGVERLVNVGAGFGIEGNHQALEMFRQDPRLHPSIGVHPHDASILEEEPHRYGELLALARREEVVAYGEIGLDYYYEHSSQDAQRQGFREQIRVAREAGKPIIVHDRDAHEEVLHLLDDGDAWELGVVIHCFSGDWSLAQEVFRRGGYLGIPGIVTFKNAPELKEVVMRAPLERLFIETDSPYLAPAPYRGRRNEPSYVHVVAREIARLREMEADEVALSTANNARRFFNLPGN